MGIVAVITVIAVVNDQSRKPSSPPPSYQPPTSSYQKPTLPSPVAKIEKPSPAIIAKPSEPQLTFVQPPIGRDNVLSVPEIRWCQREGIRLDTKKTLIKNNSQVSAFNKSVDDYNRRCGSYRYRQGSLERAKREVEKLRVEIETAARAEFVPEIKEATKPPLKQTAPVQQKPASNTAQTTFSSRDVREVQKLLSELGYQPGPIDGQYGLKTRMAIEEFQRSTGISINGQVTPSLINALKSSRLKTLSTKSSSFVPPNASLDYSGRKMGMRSGVQAAR